MTGWQTELLRSAEDLEVTQSEAETIMADYVAGALQGFMALGIMTIGIKGFYSVLGKKHAEQEEEVLEMAEEIW